MNPSNDLASRLLVFTTTNMSSSEDTTVSPPTEENEDAYRHTSFVIACVTLVICTFGLIGNTFSIIIYSHHSMRSPINVLLMGTACIDFSLSLLSIPTFVVPGIYAYYKTPILKDIVAYISTYVYPLTIMMQSSSVWAFVCITFERWQAVCRPFAGGRWSSVRRSRIALVSICALSVAYNAIRFFEFRLEYVHEEAGNSNGTDAEYDEYFVDMVPFLRNNSAYMNIYYNGMFIVTHFSIPFSILVILNGFIIRTICESRKRRRQLNKKERSEHRTAIMMIIVVCTFICCYTLLFVLNILEAADPDFFYSRHVALAFALNDISNVLVVTNAASTIVVYYFFSQKYRQLLISLLAKLCPCQMFNYAAVPKPSTKSHAGDDNNERIRPRAGEQAAALSPLLNHYATTDRSVPGTATTLLTTHLGNNITK